ncbi:MAG: toxin HicA [Candidatus Pacebacteria bacterium RIFCSPLOWO2_01_FULL_47_12]|nr:MAG: toxin HicA [Candidatus Pacebacteria bacterium RIFCSPHIGHO2_02_FULL_46_9]OGJ39385.1 MAG: toxin HicA [Candidatus Pacebacteria bacterium RIFCSPLOWO2_01_FULL_47_12]
MTKRAKRVKKLSTSPENIRFEVLDAILLEHGFICRQPSSGSSHYIYYKKKKQITVPYKRPFIKEVYIKRVRELIEDEKK